MKIGILQAEEGRKGEETKKSSKQKWGPFCFHGGDAGAKGAGMRKGEAEDDEMRTSPFRGF